MAESPAPAPLGPVVVIHDPAPREIEVALDDVELDWHRAPGLHGPAPAASAREVPGARLVARDGRREVFSISGASTLTSLQGMAHALRGVNLGAEAHLVLYELGRAREVATRHLLTRDVAALLRSGACPAEVLGRRAIGAVRPAGGVPEASDAIDALDLPDALRLHRDVLSAYPLLKRQRFPR